MNDPYARLNDLIAELESIRDQMGDLIVSDRGPEYQALREELEGQSGTINTILEYWK